MEYLNVQNTWNKISKDDIIDVICLLENPDETNVSKDEIIKKLKDVLDFEANAKIIRFEDIFNSSFNVGKEKRIPIKDNNFMCFKRESEEVISTFVINKDNKILSKKYFGGEFRFSTSNRIQEICNDLNRNFSGYYIEFVCQTYNDWNRQIWQNLLFKEELI